MSYYTTDSLIKGALNDRDVFRERENKLWRESCLVYQGRRFLSG